MRRRKIMVHGKLLLFVAVVFAVFVSSQVTWANPPDHVNLPDQAAAHQNNEETPVMDQAAQGATKHERKLKPGARSGLSISVVLPHSLKAYWEGDADAYLVFQIPKDASSDDVAMVPMKLLNSPPEQPKHQHHIIQNFDLTDLTDFDCKNLEGDYQIALILTKPNEDPLKIEDWYNGFQGLVAVSKISFAVEQSDEDANRDGKVDNDSDGDGFQDS
jgi:hypothetical protein